MKHPAPSSAASLCEQCGDGKTTGTLWTVYGVCPQVLCDYHARVLRTSLCGDPDVRTAYQRMAGIVDEQPPAPVSGELR